MHAELESRHRRIRARSVSAEKPSSHTHPTRSIFEPTAHLAHAHDLAHTLVCSPPRVPSLR
eukprot:6094551-Pleurochrysis_carterae.AAC.1